jgi:hypothetical protein
MLPIAAGPPMARDTTTRGGPAGESLDESGALPENWPNFDNRVPEPRPTLEAFASVLKPRAVPPRGVARVAGHSSPADERDLTLQE